MVISVKEKCICTEIFQESNLGHFCKYIDKLLRIKFNIIYGTAISDSWLSHVYLLFQHFSKQTGLYLGKSNFYSLFVVIGIGKAPETDM